MTKRTFANTAWLTVLCVFVCNGTCSGADVPPTPSARISCGPAALYVACSLLDVHVGPAELQRMTTPDEHGSCSMLTLKTCAEQLGLYAYGLEMSLRDLAGFDGIGIANTGTRSRSAHYVVVAGVRGENALVVDPFAGSRSRVEWIPMSRMAKMWTGRILVLSRTKLNVAPGLQGGPALDSAPSAPTPEHDNSAAVPAVQVHGSILVAANPIVTQNNEPGKPLHSAFVLSNIAELPVLIESINPCCGVTAVMTPQTDIIAADDSVRIEVSSVLPEQHGTEARTILVQVKGETEGVSIPLTWLIKPPAEWCEVKPKRLDFGPVVRGEARKESITASARGGVGIGAMTSDSPALAAQRNQQGDSSVEGSSEFIVSLDTSLIENAGLWRAKLQLSPEDGELPNAIIETVAQVRDPVVATPKQVGLGRVPCGGSSQQVVTVSINATATRILAVRSSDDRLTPRLLIGETGGTATVNVEWIPDVPGLFKGAVVIDTDNPLQPSVSVSCYGIAIEKGS